MFRISKRSHSILLKIKGDRIFYGELSGDRFVELTQKWFFKDSVLLN